MRYFYKEAAGTPLRIGGESVHFEPVGNVGGSIVGVLAAGDEVAAEVAKLAERFGIREITEADFNNLTAARRNQVVTRAVDAMAPTIPQPPESAKATKKPEPIADSPRAVVKTGKTS